jgi:tRNA modification GTPase
MEQTPLTLDDTICAIATAPGVGGIAVARVSGPEAIDVVQRLWHGKNLTGVGTHTAHLGNIADPDTNETLDQAVATVFRAPRSFTGQNVVEIAVHGSRYIQRQLIDLLTHHGARLAQPGEFTRRAFTNGRMDLAEAEAVADVIASTSKAAHRVALNQMRGNYSRRLNSLRQQLLQLCALLELELDFSEEDVEFAPRDQLLTLAQQILDEVNRLHNSFRAGQAIKNGIPVAIVGATNAGKSSLLNALTGDDRAIVSDIHGTTRDVVDDLVEIGPYTFRLMDTAGLRHNPSDEIERIGMQRSLRALAAAEIAICVIDATNPAPLPDLQQFAGTLILAINKSDLAQAPAIAIPQGAITLNISALTGLGIDTLRQHLIQIADTQTSATDNILVTNARHAEALHLAAQSISRAIQAMADGIPADLVAQDLRETIHHLAAITDPITTPALLSHIFSHFCIGK